MKLTALRKELQVPAGNAAGAPVYAEYRGAETAANFGDAEQEFRALRSGCGVFDLGFRAKISLTGNDRVR